MKQFSLELITLFCLLILLACGGKITSRDEDADEDADAEEMIEVLPDQSDTMHDQADLLSDSRPDSEQDPLEDPLLDPAEDAQPDPLEDPEAASDPETDMPELPAGCVLPTIPSTGLYVYYCMETDTTCFMRFYREVLVWDGTTIPYGEETSYRSTSASRDMLCSLTDFGAGSEVHFIIQTPSVGTGWSCGPGITVGNGEPLVFYQGTLLPQDLPLPAGANCRHVFTIPSP